EGLVRGERVGVDHLGVRRRCRIIIKGGVVRRRAFVVDEELGESDGVFARRHCAEAINFSNNHSDLGHCNLPRFSCTSTYPDPGPDKGLRHKLLAAAIGHAVDFFSWRALRREKLTDAEIIELMIGMIRSI